ncbi:hypothetical protein B0T24DRAFT_588696 [Lasiosphaeria ovina]|uniref:Uncharacterized protein n=1 Tax=Lasiosphaeria ovina TaxID=92902 RepID=A0AAE0TYI0_9PEZI|nr:hypothetical protein B0T24DRAFT_588696 [Lasiosphaeria ovina]
MTTDRPYDFTDVLLFSNSPSDVELEVKKAGPIIRGEVKDLQGTQGLHSGFTISDTISGYRALCHAPPGFMGKIVAIYIHSNLDEVWEKIWIREGTEANATKVPPTGVVSGEHLRDPGEIPDKTGTQNVHRPHVTFNRLTNKNHPFLKQGQKTSQMIIPTGLQRILFARHEVPHGGTTNDNPYGVDLYHTRMEKWKITKFQPTVGTMPKEEYWG